MNEDPRTEPAPDPEDFDAEGFVQEELNDLFLELDRHGYTTQEAVELIQEVLDNE